MIGGRLFLGFFCCLTRRFRDFPGRWRLLRWLRQRESLVAQFRPTTVRVKGGMKMLVDPSDLAGRALYLSGYQGHCLAPLFGSILESGDGVVDVGANLGFFTLLGSRLVGPGGCVHAFEPVPKTMGFLEKNVELNAPANVVLHAEALSEASGSVELNLPTDHSGGSSFRDLGESSSEAVEVRCIALDSLLDSLPRIKLVKIDVEGAELLALRGMRELLRRDHPYIVSEIHDSWIRALGGSAADLFEYLRGFGYDFYLASGISHLEEPPLHQCDVLCVHETQGVPERD